MKMWGKVFLGTTVVMLFAVQAVLASPGGHTTSSTVSSGEIDSSYYSDTEYKSDPTGNTEENGQGVTDFDYGDPIRYKYNRIPLNLAYDKANDRYKGTVEYLGSTIEYEITRVQKAGKVLVAIDVNGKATYKYLPDLYRVKMKGKNVKVNKVVDADRAASLINSTITTSVTNDGGHYVAVSASGTGSQGAFTRSGDITTNVVAGPKTFAYFNERSKSAVARRGVYSAEALAEVPAGQPVQWDVSSNSALRWEKRWYDKSNAESNREGLTLRASKAWDVFTIDAALPLDRLDFNNDYEVGDYTRLGAVVTPRWYMLRQGDNAPVDLSLGVSLSYFHTFMDEIDDSNHFAVAPVVGLHKDFEMLAVSLGASWQRGINLDGDLEVTGDDYVDIFRGALNVGVPVNDNLIVNLSGTYTHIGDLPNDFDNNYFTLGVGGSYLIQDKWSLDLTVTKDLGYSDSDNIAVHLGLGWQF